MKIKEPETVDLLNELSMARTELEESRLALERAIADRDAVVRQLERVSRSTPARVTSVVRTIARFTPRLRIRGPFAKSMRLLNLFRFALTQWRLAELLQRTAAIIRVGGWRALRQKFKQAERMAQFAAAGSARIPVTNHVAKRKILPFLHNPANAKKNSDLSGTYGMPAERWDRYLASRFTARLKSVAISPAEWTVSAPPTRRCWMLVTMADFASEADNAASIQATIESVRLVKGNEFAVGFIVIAPATTFWELRASSEAPPVVRAESIGQAMAGIPSDDIVMFLRAGDRIRPEFTSVAKQFALFDRKLALFDLYAREADAVFPLLLPGVNVLHALNCDYFRSRFVARADAVCEALGQAGDMPPYRIAIRILQSIYDAEQWDDVVHVDLPLVQIAESMDVLSDERTRLVAQKPEALFTAQRNKTISRANTDPSSLGKVSVVICTKDKGILLRQIVSSLLNLQIHLLADIIIVSNQTTNQHALRSLADFRGHDRVTILDYNDPFNFSAQSNLGAQRATGQFLLFLNDDIVPTCDNWLETLMLPFANPRIGISGPLLIYPDERIQHAGMYLGYRDVAGHTMRHAVLPYQDYMFMATAPRFVSAVTGAALLMRTSVFKDLNGFDTTFATYIQDVDLCMRVSDLGYDIVFNPLSVLIHMESPSVKAVVHDNLFHQTRLTEFEIFNRRWGDARHQDPFHNSNFSIDDETLHTLNWLHP